MGVVDVIVLVGCLVVCVVDAKLLGGGCPPGCVFVVVDAEKGEGVVVVVGVAAVVGVGASSEEAAACLRCFSSKRRALGLMVLINDEVCVSFRVKSIALLFFSK